MDTHTVNNERNSQKPRKAAAFSQAVLHKTDVGEFQDGYFVMADATKENQQPHTRNKNHHQRTERHSPERPKGDSPHGRSAHRERSAKDLTTHHPATEGDNNGSHARTSPSKSRRHSPNSQPHSDNPTNIPLSPRKPRKAYQEKHGDRPESTSTVRTDGSGSPPKGSSPTNRWAGPAFSNAPPPSSLPLPEFPPFAPLSSSPSSSPPSTSPISQPTTPIFIPTLVNLNPYFYAPPSYPQSAPYQPFVPTLDQLSMDLRRMLHINEQQVPAIRA